MEADDFCEEKSNINTQILASLARFALGGILTTFASLLGFLDCAAEYQNVNSEYFQDFQHMLCVHIQINSLNIHTVQKPELKMELRAIICMSLPAIYFVCAASAAPSGMARIMPPCHEHNILSP